MVASIQGPTTPYVVHWSTPPINGHGTVAVRPALVRWPPRRGFADPGVRMQQFVQQFGTNGLVYSICDSTSPPRSPPSP